MPFYPTSHFAQPAILHHSILANANYNLPYYSNYQDDYLVYYVIKWPVGLDMKLSERNIGFQMSI